MGRSSAPPIENPQTSHVPSPTQERGKSTVAAAGALQTPETPRKGEGTKTFGIFHHGKGEGAATKAASAAGSTAPSVTMRPGAPERMNSVQTRYMNMLLALDTIPRLHNLYASFFLWILLAGFVIFPGTFTSISSLEDDQTVDNNVVAKTFFRAFKNTPLLIVAAMCCGIGAIGMLWLWYRWRQNYVWLLNKIFLPGCLNSLTGLISTLINIYSQQNGDWSVMAKVTAIVTGTSMVVLGGLFVIYNNGVLKRVKKSHSRDMQQSYDDENFVEKVERKIKEPALEPGSVI
ncbi:MAG: hypothetical protein M1818_008115 [Claussenomyces sp. TS43310]|nr:MAG: hypothetical protein M1818_008115 [Claussenomyces sp. TS43310]